MQESAYYILKDKKKKVYIRIVYEDNSDYIFLEVKYIKENVHN